MYGERRTSARNHRLLGRSVHPVGPAVCVPLGADEEPLGELLVGVGVEDEGGGALEELEELAAPWRHCESSRWIASRDKEEEMKMN